MMWGSLCLGGYRIKAGGHRLHEPHIQSPALQDCMFTLVLSSGSMGLLEVYSIPSSALSVPPSLGPQYINSESLLPVT